MDKFSFFQGHELVLHILYHLHFLAASNAVPNSAEVIYEKFLLAVVSVQQPYDLSLYLWFQMYLVKFTRTFLFCSFF